MVSGSRRLACLFLGSVVGMATAQAFEVVKALNDFSGWSFELVKLYLRFHVG